MNEEQKEKLQGVIDRVQAATSYTDHDKYGYVPVAMDVDNREWGSFDQAMEHLRTTVGNKIALQMVDPPQGQDLNTYMEETISKATGFTQFSFLAQGTSTIVMLGRSETSLAAIRMSGHPDSYLGQTAYRDDFNRSECPALLQPIGTTIDIGDDAMQAEILPPVQVLSDIDQEDKRVYQKFLEELLEGTVYQVSLHEVMVLPDGTLSAFDPGECKYTHEYWDLEESDRMAAEEQSLKLIKTRLESWDVPAGVSPLDDKGELKQDSFFPLQSMYFPMGRDHAAENDIDELRM